MAAVDTTMAAVDPTAMAVDLSPTTTTPRASKSPSHPPGDWSPTRSPTRTPSGDESSHSIKEKPSGARTPCGEESSLPQPRITETHPPLMWVPAHSPPQTLIDLCAVNRCKMWIGQIKIARWPSPKTRSKSDRNTGSFTIKLFREFTVFGENPKKVPDQDLFRVRK